MKVSIDDTNQILQEREIEEEKMEAARLKKKEKAKKKILLEKKKKEKEMKKNAAIKRLLTMGSVFFKHGRNKKAERRFVYVDKNLSQIAWRSTTSKKSKPTKTFPLDDVIGVSEGLRESKTKPVQSENYCLTIILNTRTIQLECDNERHRNDWLEAFQWLLETRRRNRF